MTIFYSNVSIIINSFRELAVLLLFKIKTEICIQLK